MSGGSGSGLMHGLAARQLFMPNCTLKSINAHIPTMAGLIFVIAIALVTLIANLNRGQTWLPLAGLIGAGAIGL